ncbi:MAG: DMT family transporter, partial [Candidatus Thermoplasmatota archaeon]
MDPRRMTGLALAAGSGILYGSINVLAKPVALHPAWLATIMYVTSSLVLSPFGLKLRLQRKDLPKVFAMGLLGGGLAPLLLLHGLEKTAASDAGLLLTMEMVATAAFASTFIGERYRGRELVGLGALLVAGVCVALAGRSSGQSTWTGVFLVLGSAVAWGVDNTVSARLVGSYRPQGLIAVKGTIGGLVCGTWVLLTSPPWPEATQALAGAAMGIASIAVSSVLFYHALQRIGAGRTSALNIATTALVAALGGVLLLDERLVWWHGAAFLAVATGATLLSTHQDR